MREIELKFATDPSFDVATMRGKEGVHLVQPAPQLDLTAVYYDTADLRLARNGVTLRHRTGEGQARWTLKLPTAATKAMVREELDFHGDADRVPQQALGCVTGYRRSGALEPVATLRTRRERWRLLGEGGDELAVLYRDDVAVIEHDRVLTRFHELELEAVGVGVKGMRKLAGALRDAGAMPTEAIPKAVRALGPRATAPGDIPPTPEPAPGDRAEVVVAAAITSAIDRIVDHHAHAWLGDMRGVHQMRVATRRLRSDLRTLAPLVDADWATRVTVDLKWLAAVLGAVRDLDVLLDQLDRDAADLGGALDPLMRQLHGDRARCREELHEALVSPRYEMLIETLVRGAQNAPVTPAAAARCDDVLPALVARPWNRLRAQVRASGRAPSPEQLHEVRIRAKRLRYAAEAVASAVGPRSKAKVLARRAATLQDVLGEHQDAINAKHKLEAIALDHGDNRALVLAVGRLVERRATAAAAAEGRWRDAWDDLKASKATGWLKE